MTSRQLAPLILSLALFGPACGGGGDSTGPSDTGPARLELVADPSTSTPSRVVFVQQPRLRLVNRQGATVTQAGVAVTASFAVGGGVLLGTTTVTTAEDGIAAFTDLAIAGAAGVRRLVFTAPGLIPDSSTAITVSAGSPAAIHAVSADSQDAVVGSAVSIPPTVRVVDADQNPVTGVPVVFEIRIGGGSVQPTPVNTDIDGLATATAWTMGLTAGRNELGVRLVDHPALMFSFVARARPGPPGSLVVVSGANQTTTVTASFPGPVVVRVADQYGNALTGVTVSFVPSSGSVVQPTTLTADNGTASSGLWTVGTLAGQAQLTASAQGTGGALSAIITGTVRAGMPAAIGFPPFFPDSQWLPTGFHLRDSDIRVTDLYGNPVPNQPMGFSITGGGSLSSTGGTTDFDGRVILLDWQLGVLPGIQTLTVTSNSVTASRVVRSHNGRLLQVVAGDSQSVLVGQAIPVLPSVRLTDSAGTPVTGVPVSFLPARGALDGEVIGFSKIPTGPDGVATCPGWIVGTNRSEGSFLAVSVDHVDDLPITALLQPDVPARLRAVVPAPPDGQVGTTLTDAIVVAVEDRFGNGIAGAPLDWRVVQGSVSLGVPPTITDSLGLGRVSLALPTVAGPQVVEIRSAAVSAALLTVTVNALPGSFDHLEMVSGDNQTGQVRRKLATPLQVRLLDQYNNPIPGLDVVFNPAPGSGSVSQAFPAANAQGIATTEWTLGAVPGPQTLSVTRSSVTIGFHATATPAPLAAMSAIGGSGVSSAAGGVSPVPMALRVTDVDGFPAASVPVNFAVTAGGGSLTTSSFLTDTAGMVRLTGWTLGLGANALSATVASLPGQSATFTATGQPAGSSYNITLNLGGNPSPAVQQAFANASARWSQVIVGDIPDQPLSVPAGACFPGQGALNLTVDDIIVYAFINPIDGPGGILGGTGACVFRSNGVPLIAIIQLDADDLGAFAQYVPDIVLHELGHAIGVGSAWQLQGLVTGAGGLAPRFTGAAARLGYWTVRGAPGVFPDGVPLETTGGQGTRDVHWAETAFGAELMTGFVNLPPNPMSLVTTGSLQDLGYQVNNAAADLGYTTASLRAQAARGGQIPLREVPWNGPSFTVSPDGTLIPR